MKLEEVRFKEIKGDLYIRRTDVANYIYGYAGAEVIPNPKNRDKIKREWLKVEIKGGLMTVLFLNVRNFIEYGQVSPDCKRYDRRTELIDYLKKKYNEWKESKGAGAMNNLFYTNDEPPAIKDTVDIAKMIETLEKTSDYLWQVMLKIRLEIEKMKVMKNGK